MEFKNRQNWSLGKEVRIVPATAGPGVMEVEEWEGAWGSESWGCWKWTALDHDFSGGYTEYT